MSRSDDKEDYFSDPVKLVYTAEDRTFITDERFIDAEIIDFGDILSSEEDDEYDSPQKTQALVPTQVKAPDCCRNVFLNPTVKLVDFCKCPSKNKCLIRSKTKKFDKGPIKVKDQERKSENSKTSSDIEIKDQMDSIKPRKNKVKTCKNNSTRFSQEMEIQKAIEQRNIVKIVDIKKNTGLIGMKIKQINLDSKNNFGENSNKQKTNTTHTIKKVRKNSSKLQEVVKTDLKKKDVKEKNESKSKKCASKLIDKNIDKTNLDFIKHAKEDLSKDLDKFDKEKQTHSEISMSKYVSPKKACKDVEKSLVNNVCENDSRLLNKAVPEQNQTNFKQKPILEKHNNLKEKEDKCRNKVEPQKNTEKHEMKLTAGQSNRKINNVVEQTSFPKLNKFTKKVLKKVLNVGKVSPSTVTMKNNKGENHIRSSKEATQKCKDIQLDNAKRNDPTSEDSDNLKNIKANPALKLLHSPKQNANLNLELESSIRGDQNNRKTQSANLTTSYLAQSIHMNAKKAPVVKLPFPFPTIPSNTSLVASEYDQFQHDILNINNTNETQLEKTVSAQPLGRVEDDNKQKQPIPVSLHSAPFGNTFQSTIPPLVADRNDIENPRTDIIFQYNKPPPQINLIQKQSVQIEKVDMAKPPPPAYGNVTQKYNCAHQSFPDARMLKKSPIQPHNMNMYRPPPPPPSTYLPYQYYYPMTMSSVPDNSGIYTANNQSYGCRVGPYRLPYGTEIFAYPPPQPPPPPPPPLPPASQQQLQHDFNNTNQLSPHTSIIGRNNDGVIKKINIPTPILTKPDVSITQVDSKEGTVKVKNIADYYQQNVKNVNETVDIKPAVTKSGMLKELDNVEQTNNIAVFTHSPKNNLKRSPISHVSKNKYNGNRPCPLSKKLKVSDSQTSSIKGKIDKEPVTKGYSPPILPIPTFESILSQTCAYDIDSIPNKILEKSANKNVVFQSQHDHHNEIRKISLDEYKKKSSVPTGTKENKCRRLDTVVNNLYQK